MNATNRIDLVDVLRGYALLGLFLVHCVERFELYCLDPLPDRWFDAVMAIFAGGQGRPFAPSRVGAQKSFLTVTAHSRGLPTCPGTPGTPALRVSNRFTV